MQSPAGKAQRSLGATLMLFTLVCGCTSLTDPPKPPESGPELDVIVTVVSDVYNDPQRGRIIFLGTDDDTINENTLAEARALLETELQVKVRPESDADRSNPSLPPLTPVLPDTGEVGISISLGRFSVDDEGRLHVPVSCARSGLDGTGFEYTLEFTEEGWTIVDVRMTWVA